MDTNACTMQPPGVPGPDTRQRQRMRNGPRGLCTSGLALAALVLFVGGARDAFAQPLEVSGPGSSQPFIIEQMSAMGPSPCNGNPMAGCFCCRWASASESGSTSFNLYVMDDMSQAPTGYSFKCAQSGLISNATVCCEPLFFPPGRITGFLVQGENAFGGSILGRNSFGQVIPFSQACP